MDDLSPLPAHFQDQDEFDIQVKAKPSAATSSQARSKSKQLDIEDSDEEMDETFVDPPATQGRRSAPSQSQGGAKKIGMTRSDGGQKRRK